MPPRVIARLLARIMGRHGRFAILGNHDYIYGEQEVAAALRAHGIAVLDHERGTFTFGKHAIDVVGVPDAHVVRPQAQALLAGLAPDRPAIVLAHDPVWFKDVPAGPYLTLAGHTHGGQIKLPGFGVREQCQPRAAALVARAGRGGRPAPDRDRGARHQRHPAADRRAAGVRPDRGDRPLTLRRAASCGLIARSTGRRPWRMKHAMSKS